jgi:Fe-S cluster biogenesis protein NfuA
MRFEGDNCGDCVNSTRALDNGLHDELMSEVQPIKHAECHNRRALNRGVLNTMKESHKGLSDED